MTILFTNNAAATLASSITTSSTSMTVVTGQGALFPTITGSNIFYVTLTDAATGLIIEIVKVTARTSDTMTIVRAQDNTTAHAYSAGDKVELRLPAIVLQDFPQLDVANTFTGANAYGTPTSITLTNATGLPVSTGISGLGTNVATFLATPSSANLASAVTDETGSGALVFGTAPALNTPVVTNYTETLYAPAAGSSFTVSLANGTVQELSLNANGTITLPSSVAGKSFVIIVTYSGAYTLTWAGGSTIKWPSGTAPTASSASGKYDIFTFFQDGTNTYGNSFGLNY